MTHLAHTLLSFEVALRDILLQLLDSHCFKKVRMGSFLADQCVIILTLSLV